MWTSRVDRPIIIAAASLRQAWRRVTAIVFLGSGLVLGSFLQAQGPKYQLGRPPTDDEIKAWDIAIPPDGSGLPQGKGSAKEGRQIYDRRCAECHGDQGQGGDADALAGGRETLRSPKPLKTVGSYWPYATTLWDYVNRSMPFDRPGMLTADQVYAVSAYVLFLNGIIGESEEMNAGTLPKVKMPNREAFVPAIQLDASIEPSRPAQAGHR